MELKADEHREPPMVKKKAKMAKVILFDSRRKRIEYIKDIKQKRKAARRRKNSYSRFCDHAQKRKRVFKNLKEAQRNIDIYWEDNANSADGPVSSYFCEECGGWHNTHHPVDEWRLAKSMIMAYVVNGDVPDP
jgi:hypothetical protein